MGNSCLLKICSNLNLSLGIIVVATNYIYMGMSIQTIVNVMVKMCRLFKNYFPNPFLCRSFTAKKHAFLFHLTALVA